MRERLLAALVGIAFASSAHAASSVPEPTLELTPMFVYDPSWLVGQSAIEQLSAAVTPSASAERLAQWLVQPDERTMAAFRRTGQVDLFGTLGNYFDVASLDLSRSQLQSLHVLLGQQLVRPFVAIAREEITEEVERFGIGGGAQWLITPNASLGAEVLYFGPTNAPNYSNLESDLRVVGRLEIRF